jgi:putative phosphotransacetylase
MGAMNQEQLIAAITEVVRNQLQGRAIGSSVRATAPRDRTVPVGVSSRHVHLSREDFTTLFGPRENDACTFFRDLSQPGQVACQEQVVLIGPKGIIEKVRVLGPTRKQSQVEVAPSDAHRLGIAPPVRDSGDLAGSAGLTLVGPKGTVTLKEGVILAARHIHMHPDDAAHFRVKDKDRVSVKAPGPRGVIYQEVLIRVHSEFRLEFHIDVDEANAVLLKNGDTVTVI